MINRGRMAALISGYALAFGGLGAAVRVVKDATDKPMERKRPPLMTEPQHLGQRHQGEKEKARRRRQMAKAAEKGNAS